MFSWVMVVSMIMFMVKMVMLSSKVCCLMCFVRWGVVSELVKNVMVVGVNINFVVSVDKLCLNCSRIVSVRKYELMVV